jgi:hypothetical protein
MFYASSSEKGRRFAIGNGTAFSDSNTGFCPGKIQKS